MGFSNDFLNETAGAGAGGGGGDFIKLAAGESAEIVFLGDGVNYVDRQWDKPKKRVCMAVYDCNADAVKVLDVSPFFFSQWVPTIQEYKSDYRYKLTRQGSGTDTKYLLTPTRNGEIAPAKMAELDKLEWPDLHAIADRKENPPGAPSNAPDPGGSYDKPNGGGTAPPLPGGAPY